MKGMKFSKLWDNQKIGNMHIKKTLKWRKYQIEGLLHTKTFNASDRGLKKSSGVMVKGY